ncbi:Protein GLE1 [Glycine max]|nr:Protein GLE1 [Glycine max]
MDILLAELHMACIYIVPKHLMAGFALYKRYKSQFLKMLNVVSENFLVDLKSRNIPELTRTVTEIQTYIEDKKFLQEPERWRQQPNYAPNGRFNNY